MNEFPIWVAWARFFSALVHHLNLRSNLIRRMWTRCSSILQTNEDGGKKSLNLYNFTHVSRWAFSNSTFPNALFFTDEIGWQ